MAHAQWKVDLIKSNWITGNQILAVILLWDVICLYPTISNDRIKPLSTILSVKLKWIQAQACDPCKLHGATYSSILKLKICCSYYFTCSHEHWPPAVWICAPSSCSLGCRTLRSQAMVLCQTYTSLNVLAPQHTQAALFPYPSPVDQSNPISVSPTEVPVPPHFVHYVHLQLSQITALFQTPVASPISWQTVKNQVH